ncbi:MAG TPA: hypothetical protein VF627_00505 [Abditibacterium sp.]|jgi:hypothetical protein
MTTIRAYFDGQVFVPDDAVQFPVGARLQLVIEELPAEQPTELAPTPLMALYEAIQDLPDDPDAPADGAAQHDHYLHGMPKRP